VEAQQCVKLTGTNRSFDLIALICQRASLLIKRRGSVVDQNRPSGRARVALAALKKAASPAPPNVPIQDAPIQDAAKPVLLQIRPLPAWWLLQGDQTRSHPELGRQTPQRQWYFVSRHGRVGRRQACKARITGKAQVRTTTNRSVARPGPPAGPSSSSLLKSPPLAAARISLRGAERPESLRSRRLSSRSPLPTSKPPPSRGGAAR
jgi:hypothetical protein